MSWDPPKRDWREITGVHKALGHFRELKDAELERRIQKRRALAKYGNRRKTRFKIWRQWPVFRRTVLGVRSMAKVAVVLGPIIVAWQTLNWTDIWMAFMRMIG